VDGTGVSIHGHSGSLEILVTETAPGPSCVRLQAIINLLQVLKTGRPVRRVEFTQEVEELVCPNLTP